MIQVGDITSANSVTTLVARGIFDTPRKIEGFTPDSIIEFGENQMADVEVTADGQLLRYGMPFVGEFTISLNAASPSLPIIQQISASQIANYTPIECDLSFNTGIANTFISNATLVSFKPPSAAKNLTEATLKFKFSSSGFFYESKI